jgi:hypothetical protein
MVLTPNYRDIILSLCTFENDRFTGENYKIFLVNALDQLGDHTLEVVVIVCDN